MKRSLTGLFDVATSVAAILAARTNLRTICFTVRFRGENASSVCDRTAIALPSMNRDGQHDRLVNPGEAERVDSPVNQLALASDHA
jgi:hypothetical protein